ncbi:MAG: hemolysin family protein [Pseudomonadota bacterium]
MSTEPTPASSQDAEPDPADASSPSLFKRLLTFGGAADRPDESSASPLSAEEREMLLNVRRLGDLRVIDVMVPRADIEAVDLESSLEDLVDAFRSTQHTRLPVYRETLDDPLGFVHLKDLALRHGFGANGAAAWDLRSLVRPMLYVPPSMPADALLQKMQASRIHMALVIDEYGGVDGVATIEDVLEEIVGEIEDEHDVSDDASAREEGPGVWIASARLEIPEFEQIAGVDLLEDDIDEEVDTLGGLVFMLADRVPQRGEVILHPDGHEFEVLDADLRRIKRLRARLADRPRAPAAGAAPTGAPQTGAPPTGGAAPTDAASPDAASPDAASPETRAAE